VSYTCGHSIDTGSQGSSVFLVQPGYRDAEDRGSSDFDVRHNLNASLSYRLPSWHANGLRGFWFSGWSLSSSLQAHTGFPFDVTTLDRSIGLGFANSGRPNPVPGVPIWIQNNSVPGGRELNSAAFTPALVLANGALGRNVLTGPGLFQIDASLRRQFKVFRMSSLEMSANAFNLLNRASFANPAGYLGSALFRPIHLDAELDAGFGKPYQWTDADFSIGRSKNCGTQSEIFLLAKSACFRVAEHTSTTPTEIMMSKMVVSSHSELFLKAV
jgi:hypothetical protein